MAFTNLEVVKLRDSSGPALGVGDLVWVRYEGHLAPHTAAQHPDLAVEFDANYNFTSFQELGAAADPNDPLPQFLRALLGIDLTLGVSPFIAGWTQGLIGLTLGSIATLKIPASLGYGAAGNGPKIPPNADLIFTVMPTARIAAGKPRIIENIEGFTYPDLGITLPVITGITEDSGVAGDNITSDNTPTLEISATPGSTVLVWVNGLMKGAATEVLPGRYSFTTEALEDGEVSLDVEVTLSDVGRIRPLPDPVSDVLFLTVDTTAPAMPSGLALAADTGQSASDRITNDPLIKVSGLEEAASWEYRTSSTGSWMAGTGTGFSVAPGFYAAGEVQLRQRDVAGNISPAYTAFPAFTVDVTAPGPGVLSLQERTGNTDNTFLLAVSGQESGASLAFERSSDGGTTWAATTAQQNGVPEGSYQYRATATDVAGNSATTAVVSAVVQPGFAPGPWTVQGVTLGANPLGYALKVGSAPEIQVRLAGQLVSDTYPGGGWKALVAAAAGSGYHLFWRNLFTGQIARWILGPTGAYTTGALVPDAEIFDAETSLNGDLNGDGSTGLTYTPGPTSVASLNLGTTQLGYALSNGSGLPIHVRFLGQFASQANPGAGWAAIAAAASGSGYTLYWKNSVNNQYALWNLDAQGTYTSGIQLSATELKVREALIRSDLDGDGRKGPFNEQAGSPSNDVLTGQPLTVTYGFAGNDQISAVGPLTGFDIQVGGTGSDHYILGSGTGAFVVEQGNDAADQITAGGLRLQGGTSQWLTVEGKHLLAYSTATNSSLVLLNWEQAQNRIETFNLGDGTYSFDQVRSQLLAASPTMTNVTWSQIASTPVHAIFKEVGFGTGSSVDSLLTAFASVSAAGAL